MQPLLGSQTGSVCAIQGVRTAGGRERQALEPVKLTSSSAGLLLRLLLAGLLGTVPLQVGCKANLNLLRRPAVCESFATVFAAEWKELQPLKSKAFGRPREQVIGLITG